MKNKILANEIEGVWSASVRGSDKVCGSASGRVGSSHITATASII